MDEALESAIRVFSDRNKKSFHLYQEALSSLPGGNTRTALYTAPFPVSIYKGEDYKLFDVDGHQYCDLVGELTAGLYGHSHPILKEALTSAIQNVGLSLGATNPYEQRYASLICERFNIDRVRFTNSGTEANLHCIAAAKRYSGKRKVVVFRGGYHGSVLSFSNGVAPNNVDRDDWIVLQYNVVSGIEEAFEKYTGIAAVLVEGMQGSGGAISASKDFLQAIRNSTEKHNAVFILDEVMTSRLGFGGLHGLLSIKPDMITFGKYLGGGMPFGAFGGREDVMKVYDPREPGALGHSGTFQNNTLMLNAGYVGLSTVYTEDAVAMLNSRGESLRDRLHKIFQGTRFCVTGIGSIMCIHATLTSLGNDKITCKDDILTVEDNTLKKLFWLKMLEVGFWVQLRGSIALNLQLPTEAIDAFVDAVARFCESYRDLIASR